MDWYDQPARFIDGSSACLKMVSRQSTNLFVVRPRRAAPAQPVGPPPRFPAIIHPQLVVVILLLPRRARIRRRVGLRRAVRVRCFPTWRRRARVWQVERRGRGRFHAGERRRRLKHGPCGRARAAGPTHGRRGRRDGRVARGAHQRARRRRLRVVERRERIRRTARSRQLSR